MVEHMTTYTETGEDDMEEESNPGWQLAAALVALQAPDAAGRVALVEQVEQVEQAEKQAEDSAG